ncbi:MAG: hypothetical protein JXR96_03695 [Deltaproteobacteria bacterium]|nr:hypothetical protein [Deltaproteobacteria bacterium]
MREKYRMRSAVCLLAFGLAAPGCTFDPVLGDNEDYMPCPAGGCKTGCSCLGGVCVPDEPGADPSVCELECEVDADCDDGEVCTRERCERSACIREKLDGPVEDCDGDPQCTPDDECRDGACVPGGLVCECVQDIDCEDGDPCTDGKCQDGSCSYTIATGAPCDDGDDCTQGDSCDENGTCQPGEEWVCACRTDADCQRQCCDGSCNAGSCAFVAVQDGTPCDDNDDCTVGEACEDGICTGGQPPDEDGDGFSACPCVAWDCDCNDEDAAVHPGAWEGPCGDRSCSDGEDNDCDGLTDDDPGCALPDGHCSPDGWCWDNPRPTGNTIHDLWLFQASQGCDEIWMAGELGTVLAWKSCEEVLVSESCCIDRDLYAIWSGPDAVFVFGQEGCAWHRIDGTWQQFETGPAATIYDAWSSSASENWIVGEGFAARMVLEGNFDYYSLSQDMHAIWGLGGHLLAVGDRGRIERYAGSGWSAMEVPNESAELRGCWAASIDEAWAVGLGGVLWSWNGSTWSQDDDFDSAADLYAVHGSGQGEVWIAGTSGIWLRQAGSPAWAPQITGYANPDLRGLWSLGPDSAWAAGVGGAIQRFDGARWRRYDLGPRDDLNDIWSHGSEVWAVGRQGAVLRKTPHGWQTSVAAVPSSPDLHAIWGSGNGPIWVVGGFGRIGHIDDGGRFVPYENSPANVDLFDVHGSSGSDVWAVGAGGKVFHGDGSSWTEDANVSELPENCNLRSVWAVGTEVWVAGDGGVVLHRKGGNWEHADVEDATVNLLGIWADGQGDAWVVGARTNQSMAVLMRRQESGARVWEEVLLPITFDQGLESIWGSSRSGEVWAVGAPGSGEQTRVLYSDGEQCWVERSGTKAALRSVWGAGGVIWTAGAGGTALVKRSAYDGS